MPEHIFPGLRNAQTEENSSSAERREAVGPLSSAGERKCGMPGRRPVIPAASPLMRPYAKALRKASFPRALPYVRALARLPGLIAQPVRAHA